MKKNRKKGFTLVEIMIVVAIIAILAAIGTYNYMNNRRRSQATICIANLKQIQGAKESCLIAGDATFSKLYGPTGEIKQEPHCPSQPTVSYTIGDATTDPTCTYSDTDASDTSTWHTLNRSTN